MRIAVLMNLDSPWAKEAVLRFCELGHEVHVINVHVPKSKGGYLSKHTALREETVDSLDQFVVMHHIPSYTKSNFDYFINSFKLHSILRKNKIEILLTLYGGGHATMAYLSGFRPYSVYVVGSDVLFSSGLRTAMNRLTLSSADRVFANGVYLSGKTRSISKSDNIEELYLGIDTNRFSSVSEKNIDVVVLCTRGFMPVYNNEYLIEALALMPEDTPITEVVFTSSGPFLDRVRFLADKLIKPGMRKKISFLGGVSNDELLSHLRRASIFVSLSRSDGTSISMLEALACELFPVLSDIPQNREWISDELMNGLLVPLDQPESLAKALSRAITDNELRQSAASINRRLILERADGRRNMKILTSKLEKIVEKHKAKFA